MECLEKGEIVHQDKGHLDSDPPEVKLTKRLQAHAETYRGRGYSERSMKDVLTALCNVEQASIRIEAIVCGIVTAALAIAFFICVVLAFWVSPSLPFIIGAVIASFAVTYFLAKLIGVGKKAQALDAFKHEERLI